MRVQTNTTDLKAAIDAVHPAADLKSGVPILRNVLLEVGRDGLHVQATDLDMARERHVPATDGTPGAVTVSCDTLKKALAKFPKNADLTVETEGDAHVRLRAGKANLRLEALPAEDFPRFNRLGSGDENGALTLSAAEFHAILKRVTPTISNEETRYYLNGVYLNTSSGAARFVSTDGHRLSLYSTSYTVDGPKIIIPKAAAFLAQKATANAGGEVTLRWTDTRVEIACDGDWIGSKTVDGSFPDYERVFPSKGGNTLTIPVADTRAALDRVQVVATDKSRPVELSLGDTVELTCTGVENGDASETLDDATYTGEHVEIGFNSGYLSDFLKMVTGGTVQLGIVNSADPVRITDPDCPEWAGLLMPMRF